MGLGEKGNKRLPADKNGLFVKTVEAEPEHKEAAASQQFRKYTTISYELNEKLREAAFTQRRKEVDIIREALEKYFQEIKK
jgi:hypothetical protein